MIILSCQNSNLQTLSLTQGKSYKTITFWQRCPTQACLPLLFQFSAEYIELDTDMEKKKRILVVDDEPGILRVLSIQLKLHGYEPVTTPSGVEAVEIARTGEPDAILLDILLPDMNGIEVFEKVRGFSQVPVIVFSANSTAIEAALKAGANDSIAKPFNPDQLLVKIKSALEGHKTLN
jgi:CheY-like chemotaxis protein